MKPLRTTRELYAEGGAAGAAAKQVATDEKLKQLDFFKQFPLAERIDTLKKHLPEDISSTLFRTINVGTDKNPKLIGAALSEQLMVGGFLKVAAPGQKVPSMTELEKNLKVDNTGTHDPSLRVSAKEQQALVNGLNVLIDNPKDKALASRAVQAMYDPDYFKRLKTGELRETWNFLSSANRSARVAELDKQHPGVAQKYVSFNETIFRELFSRTFADAKDTPTSSSGYYDWKLGKDGLVHLTPRADLSPARQQNRSDQMELLQAQDINNALRVMGPMYEALGIKKDVAIPGLLQGMSMDLNKVRDMPFSQRFDDAVRGAVKGIGEGVLEMLNQSGPAERPDGKKGSGKRSSVEDDSLPAGAAPVEGRLPEDLLRMAEMFPQFTPGQQVWNRDTQRYEPYEDRTGKVRGKSQDRVKERDGAGFRGPTGR
jgi:hypothetical protein